MQFCKLSLSALLWILFSAGNIVAQALIPGELVQRYTFNGDTLQVLTDEVLAECSLPACDDLTVTDRYQDMPLGVGYFCGGPLQLLDEDRKRPDPFELGAEVAFPAEQRLLFACADRFSIALSNTEGEVRRFGQVFALNFTGPPIISPYHDGIADFPDVEVVIFGLIDGTSLIIDYRDEDKIRAHHTRIRLLVPGLSEPLARVRQNGELRVFFETNNGWRVYDMRTDTVLVCDAMNQRFAVNGAAIRAEGSGPFSFD